LANKTTLIISADASGAIKGLEQVSSSIKKFESTTKTIGIALTAFGTGIMTSLGLVAKQAMSAETSWMRVEQQLKLAGLSIAGNIPIIRKFAGEMQLLTGRNDELIAQFVGNLLPVTGDLSLAMEGARIAMDMAAGTGQDLEATTRIMTMAMTGNIELLRRYVPAIREVSIEKLNTMTATEKVKFAIEALRSQYGGLAKVEGASAEGRLRTLRATIGDLSETIGKSLLPAIKDISNKLISIVNITTNFISKNEQLVTTIVKVTAVIGGTSIAIGGLLLLLPSLVAGIKLVIAGLTALGLVPVVAIISAIAIAITGLTLVIKNKITQLSIAERALNTYATALRGVGTTILEKELISVNQRIKQQQELIAELNKELVNKGIINAWIKGILTKRQEAEAELNRLLGLQTELTKELNMRAAVTAAQNKTRKDAETEAEKKRIEELTEIMRKAEERHLLIGRDADTKALLQLDFRHAEEIRKLEKLGATKLQIDTMLEIQRQEIFELWNERRLKQKEETTKKEVEAEQWLTDKLNQLTLSEVEYKKMKILEAYEERAKVLGWTTELTRAYNLELMRLEQELTEQYELEELKRIEKLKSLKEQELEIQKGFYNAIWSSMMETMNLIGGEQAKWFGLFTAGLREILDIELGLDVYSEQIRRLEEYRDQRIAILAQMGADEYALMVAWNEAQIALDTITQQRKIAIHAMTANMIMGVLGGLLSFSDKNNKAMFYLQKAYAIAMAIINTAQGVTAALALGPKGIPLAAIIKALGMAQVAIIAAQTLMGPKAGVGAIPTTPTYRYAEPAVARWEEMPKKVEESRREQIINIHIYGSIVDHDAFAREIIPSIQKAVEDGVK